MRVAHWIAELMGLKLAYTSHEVLHICWWSLWVGFLLGLLVRG